MSTTLKGQPSQLHSGNLYECLLMLFGLISWSATAVCLVMEVVCGPLRQNLFRLLRRDHCIRSRHQVSLYWCSQPYVIVGSNSNYQCLFAVELVHFLGHITRRRDGRSTNWLRSETYCDSNNVIIFQGFCLLQQVPIWDFAEIVKPLAHGNGVEILLVRWGRKSIRDLA